MRHLNFSGEEILETIDMVRTEQLDIRTITVGISLLDCVSDSCEGLCRNVYDKVERVARDLRCVSADISENRAPHHQQPHRRHAGSADRRPLSARWNCCRSPN